MACHDDRFPIVDRAKFIDRNGRRFLWGGAATHQRFDVTRFDLIPSQLRHGIGREHFAALIEPRFTTAEAADAFLDDHDPVLLVKIGDDVRIYPRDQLRHHEVINDVVGGRPLFAAYCVLADLGAAYERRLGDHTLTFGVSGYTYFDPEVWNCRNAFVLWDRDSESLWWPPLGRAVSGPLAGNPLNVLDRTLWAQTEWGAVRTRYPEVQVLTPNQDFERPTRWPRLDASAAVSASAEAADPAAAHWGANGHLPE